MREKLAGYYEELNVLGKHKWDAVDAVCYGALLDYSNL